MVYLTPQLVAFFIGLFLLIAALLWWPTPGVVAAICVAVLAGVALAIKAFRWTNTYMLVTDKRIIHWRSFPSEGGVELSLALVHSVESSQGLLGHILGLGVLKIRSKVEGHVRTFNYVRSPAKVRLAIYQLLGQR